jgi:hypothetical protein
MPIKTPRIRTLREGVILPTLRPSIMNTVFLFR